MAYIPPSSSVVSFQSDPTKLVGTFSVVGIQQSSVQGNVAITNFPVVSGSTVAFLGGSTNASVITVGSPVANQSVSGTVAVSNFPTTQNVSGSVATFGSVTALQGTNPWNVSNTSVTAFQGGTWATSMVGVASVSQAGNWLFQPGSVSGVGTFNINPVGNGSIISTLVTSSVATLQGTNPWVVIVPGSIVTLNQGSSIISIPTGSIITVWKDSSVLAGLTGTNASVITVWKDSSVLAGLTSTSASVITLLQASSIVGTYSEDAAHATNDKGVFTLRVRNDTMSSITTTDGDYSPDAVGPAGETVIANAPINKWINVVASNFTGVEQPVIAAQGASIFSYVTSAQFSNNAATATLLKLRSSVGGVVIWNGVIPANTAYGVNFSNPLKSLANSAVTSSINTIASVYVNLQGFISKFDV